MKSYLIPIYDECNSFYNEATIEHTNDSIILYSYNTKVAKIKDRKAIVFGTYSKTTLRHIKEFLLQNGFKAETKKQIINDYVN